MASSTKEALGKALKKMLSVKPIDKITVKDLVEECGVNRQTFYYHFDDVYDLLEWVFEEDTNKALPHEIYYDKWRENVIEWFQYLRSEHLQFAEPRVSAEILQGTPALLRSQLRGHLR